MTGTILLAAVLYSGNGVTIVGEKAVDVARSTMLEVTPRGIDLRDRFRGFAVVDDFENEAKGCTCWRLTPNPCETTYKIAPFAFGGQVCGPVYFDPPPPREPVTGGMEVEVSKDLPPLSWKLLGWATLAVLAVLSVLAAVVFVVRFVARRVKEHLMSPIERAWVELDRLLQKGLPGRGRYKDFYVELTMVVRRYVQRKYGIRAPHLTTDEFLAEFRASAAGLVHGEELRRFLESADLVKFAGVEATPEMSDEATDSARAYLKSDTSVVV